MNFDFNDVEVINCKTKVDFKNKIKNNEVLLVRVDDMTYGINPSCIMYFN